MYLAEIRTRTQLKSESLPELGQVMKRLAWYALPSATSSVRQWLALTQFTEALDDEFLEYAVKQAKPKTVDEAVKFAMEADAFQLSRRRRKTHKSDIYMQHLDPITAISRPKISRRRHQKGKVPQAKFEPRNLLDPDQDEVSMPEMHDGDGVLRGAMPEPYAEDQDTGWPPIDQDTVFRSFYYVHTSHIYIYILYTFIAFSNEYLP